MKILFHNLVKKNPFLAQGDYHPHFRTSKVKLGTARPTFARGFVKRFSARNNNGKTGIEGS